MIKDFSNTFLQNSLKIPVLKNLYDLSNTIGLSKTVLFLLSSRNIKYYKQFKIKKRDGSEREILSPSFSMKLVQKWILERILYKIEVSEVAFAYKKNNGNALVSNASMHKHNLFILQMDLKDFFTSISRERVFYVFRNIGYNYIISNILANLCTYRDYLPQGAVTSPYLSNIICYKLDKRIIGLCGKRDVIYSRYADDLTFSCDNKNTLKRLRKIIEDIIKDERFTVNEKKTRFLSPKSRKRITGITVNDNKIKAPKEMKRKVRAMIHYSVVAQDYRHMNQIKGYISYLNSIEAGYTNKIKDYIRDFQQKNIVFFKDIVDSFNENKYFDDLEDLFVRTPKTTEWINKFYSEAEYLEDIRSNRLNYLQKKTY